MSIKLNNNNISFIFRKSYCCVVKFFLLSSFLGMSFVAFIACQSKSELPSNENYNPINTNPSKERQPERRSCEDGYKSIPIESLKPIMKPVQDALKTVTIKSAATYGYDEGAYSMKGHCFPRKEQCDGYDEVQFDFGGQDGTSLSMNGTLIALSSSSADKFDLISLDQIDHLNLKTMDPTSRRSTKKNRFASASDISLEALFASPSPQKPLSTGGIFPNFEVGGASLFFVKEWPNNLSLYKIKFEALTAHESIKFSYQKIAESSSSDTRDFFCSKQAELKAATQGKTEGEAFMYHPDVAGKGWSSFGFDYGLSAIEEGTFLKEHSIMEYAYYEKCQGETTEMCAKVYVGWVTSYTPGVVDLGTGNQLAGVTRSSWPDLKTINRDSAAAEFKPDHTYLIHVLNSKRDTFGAIYVEEIGTMGKFIRFKWKRVEIIEHPTNG